MITLIVCLIYIAGLAVRARMLGRQIRNGTAPRATHWEELIQEFPDSSQVPKWKQRDLEDMKTTSNIHIYLWPFFLLVVIPTWLWKNFLGRLPELLAPENEKKKTSEEPITKGSYR